jgi:hypothetical protein
VKQRLRPSPIPPLIVGNVPTGTPRGRKILVVAVSAIETIGLSRNAVHLHELDVIVGAAAP